MKKAARASRKRRPRAARSSIKKFLREQQLGERRERYWEDKYIREGVEGQQHEQELSVRTVGKHTNFADQWEEWVRIARNREDMQNVVLNYAEAPASFNPMDPTHKVGWEMLLTYVASHQMKAWKRWIKGHLRPTVLHWARTGLLPPEAQDAPCQWQTRWLYRSGAKALLALFDADYVGVEAVRVSAAVTEAVEGSYDYVREASEWLRKKHFRKVKRKKRNRRLRPRKRKSSGSRKK